MTVSCKGAFELLPKYPRNNKKHSPELKGEFGDIAQQLNDLSIRIDAEKERQREAAQPRSVSGRSAGYSKAYRVVADFVAAILVGGLLGYGIDWLLGILPIGLIVFLLLGFGAGLLNIKREATQGMRPPVLNEADDKMAPKVPDDEEED